MVIIVIVVVIIVIIRVIVVGLGCSEFRAFRTWVIKGSGY